MQPSVRRLRVRRAPRYEAFIGTGAVIGLLLALVAGMTGTPDPETGRAKLVGYLAMGFVLLGGLIGGALAVLVEQLYRRDRPGTGRRPR